MALTPNITGPQAAAAVPQNRTSIPFWDQGAFPVVTTTDPQTGLGTDGYLPAPGIITLLPESPNDPWPDGVSLWNTIKFNGVRAPGIAQVRGGRRRRIDLRLTPGSSGATASNMGYDPGDFTVVLTLWTPRQWAWWQNMVYMLNPPPTAKVQPVAVKVDHPGLKSIGVTDCYVESIAIPEISDRQEMRIEIDCIEFLPQLNEGVGGPKPAAEPTFNPDGTITVSSRQMPPDPSTTSVGV